MPYMYMDNDIWESLLQIIIFVFTQIFGIFGKVSKIVLLNCDKDTTKRQYFTVDQ